MSRRGVKCDKEWSNWPIVHLADGGLLVVGRRPEKAERGGAQLLHPARSRTLLLIASRLGPNRSSIDAVAKRKGNRRDDPVLLSESWKRFAPAAGRAAVVTASLMPGRKCWAAAGRLAAPSQKPSPEAQIWGTRSQNRDEPAGASDQDALCGSFRGKTTSNSETPASFIPQSQSRGSRVELLMNAARRPSHGNTGNLVFQVLEKARNGEIAFDAFGMFRRGASASATLGAHSLTGTVWPSTLMLPLLYHSLKSRTEILGLGQRVSQRLIVVPERETVMSMRHDHTQGMRRTERRTGLGERRSGPGGRHSHEETDSNMA
jgi:hypothetical protein